MALTEEGKPFHALDTATGKARSPSVERFVSATINGYDGDDRRCRRFDGGCRQDMSTRRCEGSGTPKRIGTGSAPGPTASGAHAAADICKKANLHR